MYKLDVAFDGCYKVVLCEYKDTDIYVGSPYMGNALILCEYKDQISTCMWSGTGSPWAMLWRKNQGGGTPGGHTSVTSHDNGMS
jgi:hypothetical protein